MCAVPPGVVLYEWHWYGAGHEHGSGVVHQGCRAGVRMCAVRPGIEQDMSNAVKLYTSAAEQGDAAAQFNLGSCYRHGDGVEPDMSRAVELHTQAADQGYVLAQFSLGLRYECGDGVVHQGRRAGGFTRTSSARTPACCMTPTLTI